MLETMPSLKEFLNTKHFDFQIIEKQIKEYWKNKEIYRFEPTTKGSIIIDTPPPYANGKLHHGHAMSYTQLDIIARYHRMRGPTLLPLAFDDNGLPTERYTEQKYDIFPGMHPSNFFDLCKQEAQKGIEAQKAQFDALGFSYHPEIAYRTIDERTIKLTQLDFIKLYNKGLILRTREPQLFCPRCQTALSQADIETLQGETFMHYLNFDLNNGDTIEIATTRPELIPAAMAIFYHPDDSRKDYSKLNAINPWNGEKLQFIADESIDPDTGTGIMMCASFGDQQDIELYRKYQLQPNIIINSHGRMRDPQLEGLSILEAREYIISYLAKKGHWIRSETINHAYPCCERCNTPMEIIETEQWSLEILSSKQGMLQFIDGIEFHPKHMKKRLINWIDGLKWNWTLSRQRFYGIPIPAWHCSSCRNIIIAEEHDLPIQPQKLQSRICECGADALPDPDIFDTWMSSSLTPRILYDKFFTKSLYEPLAFRSQAHEIIRTWAYYTILKQYLTEDKIKPWNHLLISGWGLGFKAKGKRGIKASKSSGSGYDPLDLISTYSADALRYWAAQAALGRDQHLSEATLNRGRKLQTKMFNAAKITFILLEGQLGESEDLSLQNDILQSINNLWKEYETTMMQYKYSDALSTLENTFWNIFCSFQIEQLKIKGYSKGLTSSEKSILLETWIKYLKLFAPFMPFITDYLWFATNKFFADSSNRSIHLAQD
ncbi:MAG: class I tRNA ligase family protein [Candidatus Heimdallarchaeota archaeon]|nr:class I tRNA ligase family protein [Candidatus Heimdallarchaeota archaeon]